MGRPKVGFFWFLSQQAQLASCTGTCVRLTGYVEILQHSLLRATLIHKLCKVRTVLLSLTKQWMDVYTAETSQCASYLMNYLLGRLQTICISTRKQRSGVAIELTKQWWIVQHP